MISRILTVCNWFGSDRPGFFSGTLLLVMLMLSVHAGGFQASLSLGPGGNLPRFRDVLLYALSHDDASSLLVNLCWVLLVGPCQERRWGTVAFLSLSVLSWAAVPCAYTLVLWVGVGDASRVCGFSAVQLALFTAQCRQVRGRRLLTCVPVWLLPWLALLVALLLLLPGAPALLHFCAICIGHNYSASFIGTLQELEHLSIVQCVPQWAYVSFSSRLTLPTHAASHSYNPHSDALHRQEPGPSVSSYDLPAGVSPGIDQLQSGGGPGWGIDQLPSMAGPDWGTELSRSGAGLMWDMFDGLFETEVLEDQMLRAGIMASLQDALDSPHATAGPLNTPQAKVELPKSSVSSLRLQQLERMGFPTEKAVVALAASKQLEGAVSLLIDDNIGSEALVLGGTKAPRPDHGPAPHR